MFQFENIKLPYSRYVCQPFASELQILLNFQGSNMRRPFTFTPKERVLTQTKRVFVFLHYLEPSSVGQIADWYQVFQLFISDVHYT